MASTGLLYDESAVREAIRQSTSPLSYAMFEQKFNNCNKCRVDFGVVGGQDVSLTGRNMVDVESDLQGRTRKLSKATCGSYQPRCAKNGGVCKSASGLPFDCDECQEDKRHLRTCNMVQYKPRPTTVGYEIRPQVCAGPAAAAAATTTGSVAVPGPSAAVYDSVTPYRPSSWMNNTGLATFN